MPALQRSAGRTIHLGSGKKEKELWFEKRGRTFKGFVFCFSVVEDEGAQGRAGDSHTGTGGGHGSNSCVPRAGLEGLFQVCACEVFSFNWSLCWATLHLTPAQETIVLIRARKHSRVAARLLTEPPPKASGFSRQAATGSKKGGHESRSPRGAGNGIRV